MEIYISTINFLIQVVKFDIKNLTLKINQISFNQFIYKCNLSTHRTT